MPGLDLRAWGAGEVAVLDHWSQARIAEDVPRGRGARVQQGIHNELELSAEWIYITLAVGLMEVSICSASVSFVALTTMYRGVCGDDCLSVKPSLQSQRFSRNAEVIDADRRARRD